MTKLRLFEALTVETLPARLGGIEALASRIGGASARWNVREVGDGNLNLVFIVKGDKGGAVVKQALPYVRLVGESWPLPLKRSFFEYHALTRQEARAAPGTVPAIYHFDEGAGAHRHGVSVAARHPAPRADRGPAAAEDRPRPRPVHGAHALPRLRPFHEGPRPQGGPGAVRRQCRALRHHREPGLHRPLFRSGDEPAHLAAARRASSPNCAPTATSRSRRRS